MCDAPFQQFAVFAGARSFSVGVALALSLTRLHAQTGTISGRVTGDLDQPIAGAQVRLVGTGLGTQTGENGRYSIVNVPAAQYRIRAQMIGHRPVELSVAVAAGQTPPQDFTLTA